MIDPGGTGGGGGSTDYDYPTVDLDDSPAQDDDTSHEDAVNDSGSSSGTDYDAGDLTGVSGDMGDDPLNDRNTVEGDNDTTAPADSTTGLTNDGTTVTDRNEPGDLTDEATEDEMPGSGMTEDEFVDSASTDSGASPGGSGTGSMTGGNTGNGPQTEPEDAQNPDGPPTEDDHPTLDDTPEIVDNVVDDTQDAVDDVLNDAEEALPDPPEAPDIDVPWKVVGGAAVLLGLVAFGPGASTAAAGAGAVGD